MDLVKFQERLDKLCENFNFRGASIGYKTNQNGMPDWYICLKGKGLVENSSKTVGGKQELHQSCSSADISVWDNDLKVALTALENKLLHGQVVLSDEEFGSFGSMASDDPTCIEVYTDGKLVEQFGFDLQRLRKLHPKAA